MFRRTVCSMLLLFASTTQAQIGRQRPNFQNDPGYWIGMSIGYVDGLTLTDDQTGATWEFGYTSQLRATFEKTLTRGITGGLSAGFSTAPLTYVGGGFGAGCGSCRANADINQYTVFIRGGDGPGFHFVYELEGGVTQFTKFRENETDTPLPPTDGGYDGTIGFGAGLSYGFSRVADVYIGQMLDLVFHRQSAAYIDQRAPRVYVFRGGFRFGF